MPIIITTNDGENQVQEVFSNREEMNKKTAQAPAPAAKQEQKPEEITEESVTEENSDENDGDDSFDYLNSEKEDGDDDNEQDDDTEDNENDEPEVEKQPKNGFKKRIDKLTKEKTDLKNRLEALEAERARGYKPVEQKAAPVIEEVKEPSINDFEFNGDYVKALTKYEIYLAKLEAAREDEKAQIQKEVDNISTSYRERVNEAKARYGEDRWNSLAKIDLPLSSTVQQALMTFKNGPDVLFYLYHHLDESKKINSLTPIEQVAELSLLQSKIVAKLGKDKPKDAGTKEKVTNAPAPVKPINSKTDGKTTNKDPNKMSFKEYKLWHASQKR